MKKLVLFAVAAVAISFASCDNKGNAGTSADTDTVAVNVEEAPAVEEAPVAEGTEVVEEVVAIEEVAPATEKAQ